MATRLYLSRGCGFSPLPANSQPHPAATWWPGVPLPVLWSAVAVTAEHRTGATEPNWTVLTGETCRNLSCYRANHSCFMLRGVYKAALGSPHLTTFGKTAIPNIKTGCSPTLCSFVQPTCTDHHVTSVSSPLLSSQPNLPLPSHPLKCLFFVKASLNRSSHGDLSSLFTPPTNYNQGLSLTLNCSLIVFPPLSLSSQLYHRPPMAGTTWHIMLLLPPTGSSTGISSTNICWATGGSWKKGHTASPPWMCADRNKPGCKKRKGPRRLDISLHLSLSTSEIRSVIFSSDEGMR